MNFVNRLSANPTKWSNTLKQFVSNLPTNCLSVFDHFTGLVPKGLSLFRWACKRNIVGTHIFKKWKNSKQCYHNNHTEFKNNCKEFTLDELS